MPAPYVTPHDLKMDFEGSHPNVQEGTVDPGDATNDAALNGTHIKIVTASTAIAGGLDTWPDGTKMVQMSLISGEAPRTTGRWVAEVYGRDDLQTDFDSSGAAFPLNRQFDGQDYYYVFGIAIPSNTGWDAGNSRPNLILKRDLLHEDKWIDGVVPVLGAGGGALHGHNAHGVGIPFNKAGQVQQFTPRPGDNFQPAISDGRPYWALQGDHGDVTNADNTFSWALRLMVPDLTMFFIVRRKARDFSGATGDTDPGRYQVWAYTKAELTAFGSVATAMAQTPIIDYTGTTNAYGTTSDTSAFDVATSASWNPPSNGTPRYMRKRPRYTYAAIIYYQNGGLTTMPAGGARMFDTGTRCFQAKADAFGTLYVTGSAPVFSVNPVVSGTVKTGYQLSTDNGTASNTPTSHTYQWQQETAAGSNNFVNVAAHGTGSTYIIPQLSLGLAHRCQVTATNASGSASAFSAATAAAALGPLDPGVRVAENPISQDGNWAGPTQSGTQQPQVTATGIQSDGTAGHACMAYRTDISSADVGLIQTLTATGNPNYAFALWSRVQNPGNATTMAAYVFAFNQGTGWRLFKCTGGSSFTQIGSTVVTNTPTTGMLQKFTTVGTTLTGSVSTDGGVTWTTILTATDSTITGAGTIGIEIHDGPSGAALQNFDQVAVDVAPTNLTAPAISGTAPVNDGVLSVTDGVWSNGATVTGYQWKRAGVDIPGATSNTYKKVQADVGSSIGCTVTAANAFGSVSQAATGAVTVTAVAPFNLVAPTLSGSGLPGSVAACTTGTWDYGAVSYTYQWQKDGVNIAAATASTYTILVGDLNHVITCNVTATNPSGSSTVSSGNFIVPISPLPDDGAAAVMSAYIQAGIYPFSGR